MSKEVYKGYTIKYGITEFQDESPRKWDNLGTLMLAEKWLNETDSDVVEETRRGGDVVKLLESQYGEIAVILKVFKYEHGGVWYDTKSFYGRLPQGHAEFDSCHTGYIWVTKEKARDWFGVKRITEKIEEKIIDCLKAEIKTFSQWANGEIYEFTTLDENGNMIDSCTGFYEIEHLLETAKGVIDHEVNKIMSAPETRQPVMALLD